jgi:hypothetical protein
MTSCADSQPITTVRIGSSTSSVTVASTWHLSEFQISAIIRIEVLSGGRDQLREKSCRSLRLELWIKYKFAEALVTTVTRTCLSESLAVIAARCALGTLRSPCPGCSSLKFIQQYLTWATVRVNSQV